MATASAARKQLTWKFPHHPSTTAIIGDSQAKYLYNHFDPRRTNTPVFVTQSGLFMQEALSLLDFIPRTVTTLVLHVGTNDIASSSATVVFQKYKDMVSRIVEQRPEIKKIFTTLVLPRAPDRRRACLNRPFVVRFNREAGHFNHLLRLHCRRSGTLFYIDHALEWLPPGRVLAADGIHPSFEGVALIASHLRSLLLRNMVRSPSTWLDHAPLGLPGPPREHCHSRSENPSIREASGIPCRRSSPRAPRGAPHRSRSKSPYNTTRGHPEASGDSASPPRRD